MMQKICNEAMRGNPAAFFLVPDHFKTEKNVYLDPWQLKDVPDHFKTQEMCDDAVWGYPFSLQFVPYWFVTQQQIDAWYDDDYWYDDDEIIGWYNSYQKRKTQKAKIKEELLPITRHPNRVMDWCMSEDEKRRWK